MEARILVVYYSRTGRTRAVGEALAQALGCEMEEIVEPRGRTGIFGSLRSAVEAWRERPSAIAAKARSFLLRSRRNRDAGMGMGGIVAGSRLSDGDEAAAAPCRLFLHPRSHRKHEGLRPDAEPRRQSAAR